MPSKIDRTGETAYNTQGRLMKIVIYNNARDMVVEFEDGVRVNRVQYDNFKKGTVRHPNDKVTPEDRVGETAYNNQGRLMKIVEYNNANDIVVEFEDGTRVRGATYGAFKTGSVSHPKDKATAEIRVGETSINTQGWLMKIVEYHNSKNIVVEFEDGIRVSGVAYGNFKKGRVSHPKYKTKAENRVGETAYNTQDRLMKIVEYNNTHDVVVEFEDGTRVSGVAYGNFKKGTVRHPKDKVKAEDRVGETAYNSNGWLMKIVEYHRYSSIVVEFEDGTRVSGVTYDNFKKGSVSHPKDKTKAENRVGETAYNTQSRLMKIVEYHNSKNIVVEFEDGMRVSGVTYSDFKKGLVRHPKDKDRTGETATASNGQTIRIIEYISSSNVMIQFLGDDLSPIKATYRCFKTGTVKNPHFPMRGKGTYKTFQTEYAYTTPSGEVYFYCECQNCGWKKNMKADDAINCHHVCEEKEAENHVKKDR